VGALRGQNARKDVFITTSNYSKGVGLLRGVIESPIGNVCKFTAKEPEAEIEFGVSERGGKPVYFVRDNGIGFDAAYAEKIFDPFQHLHGEDEFEETGWGWPRWRG
jgi:light-regulated signal transduction histidine kinase (bacteriophytochrome)